MSKRRRSSDEDISKILDSIKSISLNKDELEELVESISKFDIMEKDKMKELLEGYNAKWSSDKIKMKKLIKNAEDRYIDYLKNIDFSNLVYIKDAISLFLNRVHKLDLFESFNLMKKVDTLIVNLLNELTTSSDSDTSSDTSSDSDTYFVSSRD